MSSIGSFTFIQMVGPQIPTKQPTVAINDRAGVDGVSFRLNALKAGQLSVRTVATAATVPNTAADDYQAIRGTRVTVVDDMGRSTASVLVVDVVAETPRTVISSSPSGIYYLIAATWILQPTQ